MGCGTSSEPPKAADAPENAPKGDAPKPVDAKAEAAAEKKEEQEELKKLAKDVVKDDDLKDDAVVPASQIVANIEARKRNLNDVIQSLPLNKPSSERLEGYLDVMGNNGEWDERAEAVFEGGLLRLQSKKVQLQFEVGYLQAGIKGNLENACADDEKYFTYLEKQGAIHSFTLFGPNGLLLMRAATQEDANWFINGIKSWMLVAFSEDHLAEKEAALKELNPLIRKQFMTHVFCYDRLRKNLERGGIAIGKPEESPLTSSRKEKSGVLKMKSSFKDDKWQEYYFVLFEGAVYYYEDEKSKGTDAKGIISLQYASVDLDIPSIHKGKHNMKIITPVRNIILRCKHEAALADWITALEKALVEHLKKGGVAPRSSEDVLKQIQSLTDKKIEEERNVPDFDPNQYLYFQVEREGHSKKNQGLPKAKKGKQTTLNIGRDQSNEIVIKDDRVSRAHAKVTYDDLQLTFIDLGSAGGSKLNGAKKGFLQTRLGIGDTVKIGKTILTLMHSPNKISSGGLL